MNVTVKARTAEFKATLREYTGYSKRDFATICNTKGLFIARRAVLETPKADKRKIARELGSVVRSGKTAGKLRLKSAAQHDAPLAALIINKRLGPGKGLKGAAMEEAIRALISARNRSIAFLKSGWIPAIKKLFPLSDRGGPREDRSAKSYGNPKGDATPARASAWSPRAIIENAAGDNRDNKDALERFGGRALQRAIDAEERSMREYIERKMGESAHKAGIKTH